MPNVKVLRGMSPMILWAARHYFSAEVEQLENLPSGPALLVGNHNGGLVTPDSYVFAWLYMQQSGYKDVPVALVHDALFRVPGLRALMRALGMVPASGAGCLRELERGNKVLVYPAGESESMRPSRERDVVNFHGHHGFIRIAMRARVPIVPIVTAGAHDGWYVLTRGEEVARRLRLKRALRLNAFPIAFGLPTGLLLGPMPHVPLPSKIIIRALEPRLISGSPEDSEVVDAAAHAIQAEMQAVLHELTGRLGNGRRRFSRWLNGSASGQSVIGAGNAS